MSKALEDIIAERLSQRARGFRDNHDDAQTKGELVSAAINYAAAAVIALKLGGKAFDGTPPLSNWIGIAWPWEESWWKPGSVRRMLVKAGALIVAEIERIDRSEEIEG